MSAFLNGPAEKLTPTQRANRAAIRRVANAKPKRLREQQKPGRTFVWTPHDDLSVQSNADEGFKPAVAFESHV